MWSRRLLLALSILVGLTLVGRLTPVWWAHLTFPWDLEWMEGGMLAHAWRLREGLPLYTEPSAEWIPYIYSSGYPALLAALAPAWGLDYGQARAISLLGSWSAAAAIVFLAWRHHREPWVGVLAASLFIGTYDHVAGFFSLVRSDGLGVGLLAWSLVLALEESRRSRDVSALLLASAFLVKQNFALFGLPIAAALWMARSRSEAWRFALVSAVPALVWTGWHEWQSGGNYLDYVVRAPASHGSVAERAFPGMPREWMVACWGAVCVMCGSQLERMWPNISRPERVALASLVGLAGIANLAVGFYGAPGFWRIAGTLAVMVVTAGVLSGLRGLVTPGRPPAQVFAVLLAMTALATAAMMRAHVGGFVNVLIPLYWCSCAGAAWSLSRLVQLDRGVWAVAGLGLLLGQLCWDQYTLDTERFLPREGAGEANARVVELLREVEGPVFSPFSPWLPVRAGKAPGTHLISIWDVTHARSPFSEAREAIRTDIAAMRFGAVLDGSRPLKWGVADAYDRTERLQGVAPLMPRLGYRAYPTVLRLPRLPADGSPGSESVPEVGEGR